MGLGQQPPRFQLEGLSATGRAQERQADLTVKIVAVVNQPGWVRIPLRLGEAFLRRTPQFQGGGEHRVDYDTTAREHVLWVRGDQGQKYIVTLECAVPLEKMGEQTELRLGLPRAAVSELTLTVPNARATAVVRSGGILDESKHGDNETQFRAIGMEQDFALAWQSAGNPVVESTAPFEATGTVEAYVDASGVHSDVQMTVHGFRGRLESLRLRLPAGTSLTAIEQPGYSIEPIEARQPDAAAEFDIRLREKSAGPVLIRFATDRACEGEQRDFQIVGCQLVGAARQTGLVSVRAINGWQIEWGELQHARQADELSPELDREGVLAGFEYVDQPFTIHGRLAPRPTHVYVEPQYHVEVDAQRTRLEARLKYQIRGAKALALAVSLPGWELDDVAPRSTFDVDRLTVDADRPVRVPLVQPSTGEVELVLRAHRDLPADAVRVEFTLPRPTADAVAPAEITVTTEGDVALAVRDADLVGLLRVQPTVKTRQGPLGGDISLRGTADDMRFSADLSLAVRGAAVRVETLVHLTEKGGQVRETVVFHWPTEQPLEVQLDVPAWLDDLSQVSFHLDGKSVIPLLAAADVESESTSRIALSVPGRRDKSCQLVVEFPLRTDPLVVDKDLPIDVPLVMPIAAVLSANIVALSTEKGIDVEPRDETWNVEPDVDSTVPTDALRLSSPVSLTRLALRARLRDAHVFDPTVVERAWIQTRLTGGERWDRAVYRFSGGEKTVQLQLPPGAIAAEARVRLDGLAVTPQSIDREGLRMALPAGDRQHVLDVSYRCSARTAPGTISPGGPDSGRRGLGAAKLLAISAAAERAPGGLARRPGRRLSLANP